jgi:hypothetical protein
MFGLPLLIGVVSVVRDWQLRSLGNLIGGVSLLAALLFSLLITVLGQASDLADRAVTQGTSRRTVERSAVLRSLGSNVAYAALLAAFSAGLLVLAAQWADEKGLLPVGWSTAAIVALSHLTVTFLMVLKRAYRLLQGQIDIASTGDG